MFNIQFCQIPCFKIINKVQSVQTKRSLANTSRALSACRGPCRYRASGWCGWWVYPGNGGWCTGNGYGVVVYRYWVWVLALLTVIWPLLPLLGLIWRLFGLYCRYWPLLTVLTVIARIDHVPYWPCREFWHCWEFSEKLWIFREILTFLNNFRIIIWFVMVRIDHIWLAQTQRVSKQRI